MQAYPYPAFILLTPTVEPSLPRPRLTSRDTDVTIRNSVKSGRNEGISPFSEVPLDKDTATPSSEQDQARIVWSNDKWKLLTRSQDLLEVENSPELLSWVTDGAVDKLYSLGVRHASIRFQLAKTTPSSLVSQSTEYELTIITGQPVPAAPLPFGHDVANSPIPELDEFSLDEANGYRRSTVRPKSNSSNLANHRLSTSTEISVHSADQSSSRSSNGSYFPSHSQRSSSARVRNSQRRRSPEDNGEAYTMQMAEAAQTCWRLMAQVDWSKTILGPRSEWKGEIDTLLSLVFQSPSQDALWLGEDLQII